jgi:hypothetical protein
MRLSERLARIEEQNNAILETLNLVRVRVGLPDVAPAKPPGKYNLKPFDRRRYREAIQAVHAGNTKKLKDYLKEYEGPPT